MQVNWQQFGLRANPYDTLPLAEGGGLSLKDAFIGRESERNTLDALFGSENNVCLTVCGDTGVGKTSLANYQKLTWKQREESALFSCRREIEATDTLLDKRNFLLEIIGSVLREIELIDSRLLKDPLLSRLNQLVNFTQSLTISGSVSGEMYGFGAGVGFSRDKNSTLPEKLTMASLEQSFSYLLDFIKTKTIGDCRYVGLVVHVNNFDVILEEKNGLEKVKHFFHEVRDFLQTRDVYFLFLGPENFYGSVIAAEQRVKSIFVRTPIMVKPLSKREVICAFEKRMELLKSEGVARSIKPIPDEVISQLYDLYEGDIRSIMTSMKAILEQCGDRLLQPLTKDESLVLLGRERWERIESSLTKEQKNILRFLVENNSDINTKKASDILKKPTSNISGYYFKPLKDRGILEEKRREKKMVYFGLTAEYEPLRWWMESQKKMEQREISITGKQRGLFDEIA